MKEVIHLLRPQKMAIFVIPPPPSPIRKNDEWIHCLKTIELANT